MFFCNNCGITDNGIGNGHGGCVQCGRPLERMGYEQQHELTGIERHWQQLALDRVLAPAVR